MLRFLAIVTLAIQPLLSAGAFAFVCGGGSAPPPRTASGTASTSECCCTESCGSMSMNVDACGCIEEAPAPQREPAPWPARSLELPTLLTATIEAVVIDRSVATPALGAARPTDRSGRSHNEIRALLCIWRT